MKSIHNLKKSIEKEKTERKNEELKINTIERTEDMPNFVYNLPEEGSLIFTADPRNLKHLNNKDLIESDNNIYYYNSSICKYKDFYRLFYRCGRNPKTCEDRIATCLLTKELQVVPNSNKYIDAYSNWQESRNSGPDVLNRHIRYRYSDNVKSFIFKDNQHIEDPRAVEFQGNWFVFYTDGLTVGVAKLELDTCNLIYSHYLQVPPTNIISDESDGREKNWIPIVSDNKLYILYSDNPRTFIHCIDEGDKLYVEKYDKLNFNVQWMYGKVRGGCPPVEYDKNTLIWFFHSSKECYYSMPVSTNRIYFIGAYLTSKSYPFDIKSISKFPIFFGTPSPISIDNSYQTNVVFPCGSVSEDDEFLISMGINDYCIGHLKVTKKDIIWKNFEKTLLYLKFK